MKKHFLFFGISILLSIFSFAFVPQHSVNITDKINWLTLEEAFAKTQKEPRKTIIDVYTDWCGWCKVMDRETFTNKQVINYINSHYYAVKFNAESRANVTIGTSVYKFDPKQNAHQAAIALLGGKLSFPTTVYLDEKFNMIQPIPGYQDAKNFHQIITFLGGDYYKKEAFEKYKTGTYKDIFKAEISQL